MCKGSSRGAGEGLPLKRRKTAAFCYFSVPQAPSVTLARDTFLPEEGSWRRAALPQKKSVQTFGFKALDFHFYFRFFRNLNTPQSPAATAPLLKRGQPIGVRLHCRTKNPASQSGEFSPLSVKKSVQNRSAPLPPQGSGAEIFSYCNRDRRFLHR